MSSDIYLGAQGWTNRTWVGPFYPPGTLRAEMLAVYATAFSTVEVQRSFHEFPSDPEVRDWREAVGPDFRFSFRLPMQITHEKRLVNATSDVAKFLGRVEKLGERLGPILVQIPTDYATTVENRHALRSFVGELPAEFRWAVEFRDARWLTHDVTDALAEINAARVLTDGRWIKRQKVLDSVADSPSDWLYIRWPGQGRPVTDFSRAQHEESEILSSWASVLWPVLSTFSALFGYFGDQFEGHAPHSIRVFQRMMGQTPADPSNLRVENAVP